MRRFIFVSLVIVLILSVIGRVDAFGLTPGRTTLNYEPGKEKTIEFSVINSDKEAMQLVVFVQGELNESISLSEVSFSMTPSEGEHKISYTFKTPSNLKPGKRTVEIVVVKLPTKAASGATFVGAAVGVATQLHVLVPYPGKYADVDLNVVGPDDKGTVNFLLPVTSQGDLDLIHVRGLIEVYSSLNEKVASISTDETSLKSGEHQELVATWDAKNLSSGVYRASATLIFDEGVNSVEKTFELGKRALELQAVQVHDFSLGDIAKFEFLVENKWGQPITNAYLEMLIYNTNHDVMADFKSATYDVAALNKQLMVAFWDTKGVKEGTYSATALLKYGQASRQQDLQLKVSSNDIQVIGLGYVISQAKGSSSGGSSTLIIVLITIIVVLVLINVLWFFVLRKRVHSRT